MCRTTSAGRYAPIGRSTSNFPSAASSAATNPTHAALPPDTPPHRLPPPPHPLDPDPAQPPSHPLPPHATPDPLTSTWHPLPPKFRHHLNLTHDVPIEFLQVPRRHPILLMLPPTHRL